MQPTGCLHADVHTTDAACQKYASDAAMCFFELPAQTRRKTLALKLRVPRAFVIAKRPRDPRLSQKTHGSFVVLALVGGQDVQRPCDPITAVTLASESDSVGASPRIRCVCGVCSGCRGGLLKDTDLLTRCQCPRLSQLVALCLLVLSRAGDDLWCNLCDCRCAGQIDRNHGILNSV